MSFLIGIGGGSGSGKTSVAKALFSAVGPEQATILAFDNYYADLGHLPELERIKVNFDHPDSLDSELLSSHLNLLQNDEPIEEPTYDFNHHTRAKETIHIEPTPVIIVEGILTLSIPELVRFFDLKIYVETDADIRFIRRLSRDTKERGRLVDQVIEQYESTVRPMHLEFVEPSKRNANIIIPEGGENSAALDLLIAKVKSVVK